MIARKLIKTVLLSAMAALLAASPPAASPVLHLDIHHDQTHFNPAGGAPGLFRAATATDGSLAANEQQEIEVYATGGQFRLSFESETTADLPIAATGAQVRSALEALPSIGAGNVAVAVSSTSVNLGSQPSYGVTFIGGLANTDVPQLGVEPGTTPFTLDPEYTFDVENLGDTPTSEPVTLTVNLPAGITLHSARSGAPLNENVEWNCPSPPGSSTVTCTTAGPIARRSASYGLDLAVDVKLPPSFVGERTIKASLSGGGAAEAPPAAGCAAGKAACAVEQTEIDPTPARFGILPATFTPDFLQPDAVTPVRRAGSHPAMFRVPFDLSTVEEPVGSPVKTPRRKAAAGDLHDLTVDLPPGFIGNPTAVGECAASDLELSLCPPSSVVGTITIRVEEFLASENTYSVFSVRVFNMAHPRGSVADLAFVIAGNPVRIKVDLDPANHYAIVSHVPDANESLSLTHQLLTIWGVPTDSSHDAQRCASYGAQGNPSTAKECSTDAPRRPFLSVPSQCESDNTFRLHHYDSWQEPGNFGPEIDYTLPGLFEECEKPRFEPEVEIEPTGKQANTPTGLDVHVKIKQNENADALATPPVKRFTVTLPEGMSFSPSFADGLKSCTLAQMQLGTNNPVECPDASRIGEVDLHSPLLPKALEGSMYLAAQGDNPFGSTFALLLVLHDVEERGILVKIPGRIDVDETTGQIVTVFSDTPQFPFDDLTLKFRSGPRAPLVSPPSCGKHTIGVEVASYAQPQDPVDASNTYDITEGPNGTPCPPDSAHRPFHPTFTGGTLNPVAGSYSTFLFRMTRTDDEQELSQVSTILPPGLVAKIAGVSLCPDGAIDSISTELGTGRQELEHPACPASSFLGTVSAGLGAGPGPNYFDGRAYLAGPYKGAPLSLAVVAPGLAGPYDLGNVVVRTALYVDPDTAQVKAVSDPFPTILHGVILRVRDVRIRLDRPETTINPTNCDPMSLDGQITGVGGDLLSTADDSLFAASSPFQVGSCSDLSFKPKLDIRLFGGTRRGAHPKFKATATFPKGGANTAFAQVALPHSEFLDQGHIGTVCTRPQFAANACPAASIYGTVSAKTPLLDEELNGNIYLRSSSHQLPDIVAAFRGGRIDANLVGRVDSIHGGIRNTFEFVPDVPVTSATFTFFGGKKGLLVNSRNICKGKPKATALFKGQNGDELTLRPVLKSACKTAKKSKRRR